MYIYTFTHINIQIYLYVHVYAHRSLTPRCSSSTADSPCPTRAINHSFSHTTHLYVKRLIDMSRATTHSYVTWLIHTWCDSFICDTSHSRVDPQKRIEIRDVCHCVFPYIFFLIDMTHPSVTFLIHTYDMTHSSMTRLIHLWHDSFIRDLSHPHIHDTTHSSVTWLIHTYDMTSSTSRPRSFLETGFRPLCPSFVWFVPLPRTTRVFLISTRTRPRS